ncbi:EAL domain-containing protein [Janthinobacterium sp. 17J80-10]|uniref:bifunctional diguanylate cyclase/phosphodiesterase n=1 Tax=Janthinobacterium sp. 17J80-10 TaxID=2497863 RepID=UPI0010057606|nr:EAL domain-containing protein [Janthinobacterium sp. 17J80-10]QAU33097.1 EAL domain-containing protein [Janthinobacterium sp. 17J80-10]
MNNKNKDKRPGFFNWIQSGILPFGLIATAILTSVIQSEIKDHNKVRFEVHSKEIVSRIEQELVRYTEVLRGVHSQFISSPKLSAESFEHAYKTLEISERLPAIQALGFSRRTENPQQAYGSRKAHPVSQRATTHDSERYLVEYAEPFIVNKLAIGFDQLSEPTRSEAMRQARDKGGLVATGPIRLLNPVDGNEGVIFFMPVFEDGNVPETIADRRKKIIGFVFLAVRINEALTTVLNPQVLKGFDVAISDIQGLKQTFEGEMSDRMIFKTSELVADGATRNSSSVYKEQYTLPFSGGLWHFEISADQKYFKSPESWMPLMTVASGILATLLLFFIVRHLQARHEQSLMQKLAAQSALMVRERAIEASANAIIVCRAQGPDYPVEYVNPAFERMTGYAPEDICGKSLRILHGSDYDQIGLREIRAAVSQRREGHAVLRNYRKNGSMFWTDVRLAPVKNDDGIVTHFVAAKYDVTESKKYQEELEFQATHDSLTGLPNRSLLQDRLERTVADARRDGRKFWVVFVDLDRFKYVNDTMGHSAGDILLQQVSERLKSVLRASDTVARHGGDEFILIIGARDNSELNASIIQRIMDELADPIKVNSQEFFVTSSIGIAVYPDDGTESESLIKHADVAMYRAKELGRNNYQFYSAELNHKALDRLKLEKDLRLALERDEFVLHYQPQISLDDGTLGGMEALIRWNHPNLGAVSPGRFISLAEETGLIVPIGYWVIESACRQNKIWQDAGFPKIRVAVNMSARQFAEKNLVDTIINILNATGLAPQYLEIELTEGMVMQNVEYAIGVLSALKQIGIHVSIDDFGTGYSSLAYLKRFPIDMLKIDQSFVRDIADDADDAAIVRAIISLSHSLRLKVIAEGVENEVQLNFLKSNHCDQVQGYYFSRPLPAQEMEKFLHSTWTVPVAG